MATTTEPYTARISRENPTCVLILVDQSKSMSKPFGQQPNITKAEGVATELNRLLTNLVLKSTIKGGIGDYTHIGVMGFGSNVGSIFAGELSDRELVPVSEIAENPLRIDTHKITEGSRERTVSSPVWIVPRADGDTPMADAFTKAHSWIKKFLNRYPDCFPPTVICITDGMPTHVNPREAAKRLRELRSSNGNVLLFNVHITDSVSDPVLFPAEISELPDDVYARFLYRHSSIIPYVLVQEAKALGFSEINDDSHGFIFNGDFNSVTKLLTFGTRVNNN